MLSRSIRLCSRLELLEVSEAVGFSVVSRSYTNSKFFSQEQDVEVLVAEVEVSFSRSRTSSSHGTTRSQDRREPRREEKNKK